MPCCTESAGLFVASCGFVWRESAGGMGAGNSGEGSGGGRRASVFEGLWFDCLRLFCFECGHTLSINETQNDK